MKPRVSDEAWPSLLKQGMARKTAFYLPWQVIPCILPEPVRQGGARHIGKPGEGRNLQSGIPAQTVQQGAKTVQVSCSLRVAAFDEVVMMHDGDDDWVKRSKGAKRIERGLE